MTPLFSFVLVCQAGELEIKASLLAASLRYHLGGALEIIAGIPIPEQRWGSLRPLTKRFLDELNVRQIPIENRIEENYGYANKISAIAVDTEAQKIIFLDSDILCLRAPDPTCFRGSFCAKPADLATWGEATGNWEAVYGLFGLNVPSRRVVTTVSGKVSPPYFNAGVVAVKNGPALASYWEESCIRIDQESHITDKRPWLDQIGLPVAVARLGIDFHVLGDDFNYPAHIKPMGSLPPVFCHYHWPVVLRREPVATSLIRKLATDSPKLEELIRSGGENWKRVLDPTKPVSSLPRRKQRFWRKRPAEHKAGTLNVFPEVVITGIPRSGTSLLCRLLHDQPDCVIINEPKEIFKPLTECRNPWWIGCYYADLRRRILEGEAIENKAVNGEIIEDTRKVDRREPNNPIVSRADFLFGTKNTLVYLARIPVLQRALPRAPVVVCVRHPLDTIASWKGSFQHLREVDFGRFPVSYTDNLFLDGKERQRLQRIDDTESSAQRRALLWSHLAETVENHRTSIILLRYEDLIKDPTRQIKRILSSVPNFDPPALQLPQLTTRSRRELLDEEDLLAISDLCSREAAYFGYNI